MVLTFTTPVGASAAAEATCQGRQATQVGMPGQVLTGTDGADVLVSNGATGVEAGAGDDVICVTGAGSRVTAGDGDDSVEVSVATGQVHTQLGTGTNTYTSTGDVADEVVSGTRGAANGDVLHLGPGDNALHWQGTMTGSSQATDVGLLYLWGYSGDVRFGARLGKLSVDGTRVATLRGVHRVWFDAGQTGRARTVTTFGYRGSPGPDEVRIYGAAPGYINLRGGDDLLITDAGDPRDDHPSYFYGGPGSDTIEIGSDTAKNIGVNLRTGSLRVTTGNTTYGYLTSGFEHVGVAARKVSIEGNGKDNRLRAAGCRVVVEGRGGNDTIAAFVRSIDETWMPRCTDRPRFTATVDGGKGRDRIEGTPGPDVLVGGPGRDHIDGSGGRDTCDGEKTTSCEARPRD